MEIIVGKYSGFCNGAKNAVSKTIEELGNNVFYSVGEIVHNEVVVNDLKKRGLVVKNDLSDIPNNANLIMRAHGEGIDFYREAKRKNLHLVDLTCGRVKLIHNKILNKKNSFVIIIGKKNHPETIAHKSYSDFSYVIEDFNDIPLAYKEFLSCNKKDVYIVAQTTFNGSLFDDFINEIRKVFINANIEVDKTICNATSIRQQEAREIASYVDKMIVIGGKNSSNTRELAVEANKICKVVYLIEMKDDLNKDMFNEDDCIGITAGASTPNISIDEVVEYLTSLYKKIK